MTKTVRVIITGRVQRVGFRHWTQLKAESFGLDGWVKNKSDGTVEALFSGLEEAVDAMLEACEDGPRFANVTSITPSPADLPSENGFIQYRG